MTRPAFRLALLGGLLLAAGLIGLPRSQPAQGQAEPTPLPLYALPNAAVDRAYTGGSLALLPDGRTLVVANPLSNSVTITIPTQERVIAEVPVGREPRAVAITPDGALALAANRLDSTLSLIDLESAAVVAVIPLGGASPVQVVMGERGLAYVALRESNEVVEVDVAGRAVIRRIATAPAPSGLVLWGDFLYVTHFWPGTVSLIYLPQGNVVGQASLYPGASLAAALAPDISRGLAYAPFTELRSHDPAPLYDSLALPAVAQLDLRALQAGSQPLPLDSLDRPVNLPLSAALDRFRQLLYVANFGSASITVLDLAGDTARANIPVGSGPFGLALNPDYSLLYVHNLFDGTVSTVNTQTFDVVRVQVVAPLGVPADVIIGAQAFNGAADPRLTTLHGVSCATCHFDGLSDGRVWQGINGGRNTPLLYGLADSAPYLADGAWDDLADIELRIRALQAGEGLIEELEQADTAGIHAGLSDDLDALTAWLLQLPAPVLPAAGTPEGRERGRAVFAEQGCETCHSGPAFTSQQLADVGTGGAFDTPSLRWLALSAPYFHDGRAATLRTVFELPGAHQLITTVPAADLDALLDYLLSLPEEG